MLHFGIKSRAPLEGRRNFVCPVQAGMCQEMPVYLSNRAKMTGLREQPALHVVRLERKTFSDGQNLLCETAYNYNCTEIKKRQLG